METYIEELTLSRDEKRFRSNLENSWSLMNIESERREVWKCTIRRRNLSRLWLWAVIEPALGEVAQPSVLTPSKFTCQPHRGKMSYNCRRWQSRLQGFRKGKRGWTFFFFWFWAFFFVRFFHKKKKKNRPTYFFYKNRPISFFLFFIKLRILCL